MSFFFFFHWNLRSAHHLLIEYARNLSPSPEVKVAPLADKFHKQENEMYRRLCHAELNKRNAISIIISLLQSCYFLLPPRHDKKRKKCTLFFYKNKVYKNVEPQICPKLKNILDAEIVIILQLFLSPHMEAQNTFFARKSCLFWHVLGKYQVKNSKICENFANFSKN